MIFYEGAKKRFTVINLNKPPQDGPSGEIEKWNI